ncbi:tRNA epoxyqueuosine(34) reductase QueG [Flavobacteriales bacterium AH-315-E23]|nr:tRNA epoxyqueuosine(34) reductase QueG [Flavobacteriales bacterium AH-315-E23]
MNAHQHTKLIKEESIRLGFSHCGISEAGFLSEEAPRLERWLKEGMHGKMQYMERNFDKRLDPTKLVHGAKSVISLLLNYFPEEGQADANAPKISKYAYGTDYHLVIKDKLHLLVSFIKENIGDVNGRVFVDSAPVLDKVWAQKSGLGWIGKHTNLINKDAGSFFFIAEIICDLKLDYDVPVADHCGTCTMCIDACPTDAIVGPYVVDGSKCISYFTIELREEIPSDVGGKFDGWAFGCDICQDVCPWNRFSTPHRESQFQDNQGLLEMGLKEWDEMTEEVFNSNFKDSPLSRTGFEGMKRNLSFLKVAR